MIEDSFVENRKFSLKVWILSCIFGIGSWIALNGMFVELPNLVNHLPEGWKLPSYMTFIIQFANVGPIVYILLKKYVFSHHKQTLEHVTICVAFIFGIIGCVLLACLWDKTSTFLGSERSTAFLSLTFVIALVDCTSSVTFLPFMSLLPAAYISPFYVGENLSSLVGALFGLGQGVEISNGTAGEHGMEILHEARFSQGAFFAILAVLMFFSFVSYAYLSSHPTMKNMHIDSVIFTQVESDSNHFHGSVSTEYLGSSIDDYKPLLPRTTCVLHDRNYFILYCVCMGWLNFLQNGVVSAVGSFAYAPYGDLTFHFASTLGPIVGSLACFSFMFYPKRSANTIMTGTIGYTITVVYVVVMATMSPHPLWFDNSFGSVFIVLIGVVSSALVSYTKLAIASVMRDSGHKYLFYIGIVIQLGSFVGAMAMFPIVNYTSAFKSL